jgi:hypothetical protein
MQNTKRCAKWSARLSIALAVSLSIAACHAGAGDFSDQNFTGDADSGINFDAVYTHALNFNVDDNLKVNGAVFTGTGAGVAAPATNTYRIDGTGFTFNNNANNLSGQSNGLASDFVYNGNPQVITLNNLIPGQSYQTTFYSVGFGPVGDRVQDIATGDGAFLDGYDQNKADQGNGNRLSYAFTASAPSQSFTITPQNPANTFHTYALTNRLVGYQSLLTDNFYLGTSNGDPGGPAFLNSNLDARQGGTLPLSGPVTYTVRGNVQVGNGPTGPVDRGNFLLTAFGGAASPDHNFNSVGGGDGKIIVSFDMAPNLSPNTADPNTTMEWGGISMGLSQANQAIFINGDVPHFGILFRGNGGIQAFDGANDITASGTAGDAVRWYPDDGIDNVTNELHHFDLVLSDPTLATIDVYADGNFITSFSKPGGFSDAGNNYINLLGERIAGFDNFQVAQAPEPATLSLLALGGVALLGRRRKRNG